MNPGNTCNACTKSGCPPKLGIFFKSLGRMVSTDMLTLVVCSSRSAFTSALPSWMTCCSNRKLRVVIFPSTNSMRSDAPSYSMLDTTSV